MQYTAFPNQHVDISGLERDEALNMLKTSTQELAKIITNAYPQISLLGISRIAGLVYLEIPEHISVEEVEATCHCKLIKDQNLYLELIQ
ncbi:MAG: hypothetical protein U1A25_02640, partial [Candidatus Sungbacteria bacterium]|nr:hypothetical protein [bacterium]MDZ4260539.1 hypothetical protein [Candidatus Sungbacteria bacterium]